jgi:hypothetical protein
MHRLRTAATMPVIPSSPGWQPGFYQKQKRWENNVDIDDLVDMPARETPDDLMDNPAFYSWFKGSWVCDDDGNPITAYHGTNSKTKAFVNNGKGPYAQLGHWFDTDSVSSTTYALGVRNNHTPNVIAVYLSIKNPKEFTDLATFKDVADGYFGPNLAVRIRSMKKDLVKKGFDGVVIHTANDGPAGPVKFWCAFSNKQIKSAVGNSGAYDGSSSNIMASLSRLLLKSRRVA